MPPDKNAALRDEEQFLEWMAAQSARKLLVTVWGEEAVACSELINLAVRNGYAEGRFWMAIRLSDGGSDEVAYATKKDAIKHQLHERQCAYVRLTPDGMSPKAAYSFLKINRALYDAGFRITDPDDARRGPILPV